MSYKHGDVIVICRPLPHIYSDLRVGDMVRVYYYEKSGPMIKTRYGNSVRLYDDWIKLIRKATKYEKFLYFMGIRKVEIK